MKKLTPNDVLKYIVQFKTEHNGIAPTIREIKEALEMSSTSVAAYHLRRLELRGEITYPLGEWTARAIAVPGYEFTEANNEQPTQKDTGQRIRPQDETQPRRESIL